MRRKEYMSMKDSARNKKNVQRKILREARKEEEPVEEKGEEEPTPEAEGVEVEELPLLRRPLNRKFH